MDHGRRCPYSLVPTSRPMLDVGCGTGNWLRAAQGFGVAFVLGVDGVPPDSLQIAPAHFLQLDLTQPLQLEQRFEVALCLEVGEHLPGKSAAVLIRSLTAHADCVLFS